MVHPKVYNVNECLQYLARIVGYKLIAPCHIQLTSQELYNYSQVLCEIYLLIDFAASIGEDEDKLKQSHTFIKRLLEKQEFLKDCAYSFVSNQLEW